MRTDHANGADIPILGLGTFPMRGEACTRVVSQALTIGYRHIDTAQIYNNETEVGAGMRQSGIARDLIFLTTKIGPERLGDLQASLEKSLVKLQVDQVDMTLIHWPNPAIPVGEAVAALCDAKRRGLTRHIGVSNFVLALLDQAVAAATEPLAAEQIEYHPYLDQSKMLAALRRHGMATVAYSPIALGEVVADPVIAAIGKAHGKSTVQVTLRWLIQQNGVVAIPKTSKLERLKENLDIFDFALTADEMAALARLSGRGLRLVNEPAWVPRWD